MELRVNQKKYNVDVDENDNLLTVLRNHLDLTGSKTGCGEGVCGACTVLVEGRGVRSCITPVGNVKGKAITTIEGLEDNGKLHAVQEAFLLDDVFQCGYCASGMIMSAVSLLNNNASPGDAEIKSAMQGNICRCGTYRRILRSLLNVADMKKR